MPLGYGKRTLNDAYELYPKDIKDNYIGNKKRAVCKFYAKDYVSQASSRNQLDGFNNYVTKTLTIKALINEEVKRDDLVKDLASGKMWRVKQVVVEDDNTNKANSSNPRQYVILYLEGDE